MAEKVRDGIDGLHFRVGNAESLAEAMAARDPRARRSGTGCAPASSRRPPRPSRPRQHAELFERLLARRRREPAGAPGRPEPWPRRPTTPEFREAMRDLAQGAGAAAFVGLFVNLMHLALPLYTNQIYDRVISSGSMDTLMALTLIVAIVLGFQAVLDYPAPPHLRDPRRPRRRAARPPGLRGRGRDDARATAPAPATGAMRDLGDLRTFIASGAIALPMDILVTPLFLVVLFLLHPLYGMIGLVGAALLLVTGVATEVAVAPPDGPRATPPTGTVHAETAAAIRNAEVIVAMGMLPAVARRWRRTQAQALDSVERGRAVAKALTAAAKGAAHRPADRQRLRRRHPRHQPRGLRRHHRRRRRDQLAACSCPSSS